MFLFSATRKEELQLDIKEGDIIILFGDRRQACSVDKESDVILLEDIDYTDEFRTWAASYSNVIKCLEIASKQSTR